MSLKNSSQPRGSFYKALCDSCRLSLPLCFLFVHITPPRLVCFASENDRQTFPQDFWTWYFIRLSLLVFFSLIFFTQMTLLNITQLDHLNSSCGLVFFLTFDLALLFHHSISYNIQYQLTQYTLHLFIYFFVCFISYPQDFKLHEARNISFFFLILFVHAKCPNFFFVVVIVFCFLSFLVSPIVSAQIYLLNMQQNRMLCVKNYRRVAM